MKEQHLDDLSEILENNFKKANDHEQTFQESKPLLLGRSAGTPCDHIRCSKTNTSNYQCSICNRLRKVCPYQNRSQNQNISIGLNNSANSAFSFSQSADMFANLNKKVPPPPQINPPPARQQIIHRIPQIQQVVYYPVIHNRLVIHHSASRNNISSHHNPQSSQKQRPSESRYSQKPQMSRKLKISDFIETTNEILTPNELKQAMESMRNSRKIKRQ